MLIVIIIINNINIIYTEPCLDILQKDYKFAATSMQNSQFGLFKNFEIPNSYRQFLKLIIIFDVA